MATRRQTPDAPTETERCRVIVRGDVLHVALPIWAYRVLFADGSVVNVEAIDDGFVMRGAVLEHRHIEDDRIEGVAQLGCVGWTDSG